MIKKQFRKSHFVAIIAIGIFIVLRIRIPEDVTEFDYYEVVLPQNSVLYSYSLIPDGSGIIYIVSSQIPPAYSSDFKNSFYYLDFEDKSLQLIHKDELARTPAIFWVNPEIAILTSQTSWGRCYDDTFQEGTVSFNLETNEKQPAECLDGKGLVNPQFDTSRFGTIPYSSDSNKKIYSLTQKYYFVRRFIPGVLTARGREYIDIYNAYGVILRTIRLGPTGQMTAPINHTGYIGFWTNKDEIVISPSIFLEGPQENRVYFYFIPPQK